MNSMEFDPIDYALLVAGYLDGCGDSEAMNIERADNLLDVARMLHTLWKEIPDGEWVGVWAYDVAEPLGFAIGNKGADNIEETARELIAATFNR